LTVLREGPQILLSGEIAYARGRCWAELGDIEASLAFFGEANRLSPRSYEYSLGLISSLMRLGRHEEVARLTADALASEPIIDSDAFRLITKIPVKNLIAEEIPESTQKKGAG